MSDVLIVSAPVPGAYPTVNTMWAGSSRGGKKSLVYTDLFDAVQRAAEAEIDRTGWTTAAYYCAVSLTLYRNTRREIDCANTSKAELDAMTAAGVWVDDKFARPFLADTEYDPSGESRVVIVVRRRFPDMHFTADAPAKVPIAARLRAQGARKPRSKPFCPPGPEIDAQEAIFGRTVLVDGRPATAAEKAALDRHLGRAR